MNEIELQDSPDNVVSLSEAGTRSTSKMDLKRQQIRQERRQRLLNQGVPPDQVEARLNQEDWDRLPADKKINRMLELFGRFREQVAQDIQSLRYNEQQIADIMDVNFRAMAKMLNKLGLSKEDQSALIQEAQQEVAAELAARQEEAQASSIEKELTEAESKKVEGSEEEELPPAYIPDGATLFGGSEE